MFHVCYFSFPFYVVSCLFLFLKSRFRKFVHSIWLIVGFVVLCCLRLVYRVRSFVCGCVLYACVLLVLFCCELLFFLLLGSSCYLAWLLACH